MTDRGTKESVKTVLRLWERGLSVLVIIFALGIAIFENSLTPWFTFRFIFSFVILPILFGGVLYELSQLPALLREPDDLQ